jgi:hypothetical protein
MGRQLKLAAVALLLSASVAYPSKRPAVRIKFALDARVFKVDKTCRDTVAKRIEECARSQTPAACEGGVRAGDDPQWWDQISFVDFDGGTSDSVWQLTLGCNDPNTATSSDCPLVLHARLDGGPPQQLEMFTRNQYSYVMDECLLKNESCDCDALVGRILDRFPDVVDTNQDLLAELFGRYLRFGTDALPDPDRGAWVLPFSRDELQTGVNTEFGIQYGTMICRARDLGEQTGQEVPQPWQERILSEVSSSGDQLDQRCLSRLGQMPRDPPQPLEGVKLTILCYVHPKEVELFDFPNSTTGECR